MTLATYFRKMLNEEFAQTKSSITMMGVAMLGLALTPGYARIGIAAPLLLLLLRLLQGFALGGEVGRQPPFWSRPRHRANVACMSPSST